MERSYFSWKSNSDCEFILPVFSLADNFSVMLQFSKYLQNKNIETDTAKCNLMFLEDTLIDKRNNADSISELIFNAAKVVMEEMDVDNKIPEFQDKRIGKFFLMLLIFCQWITGSHLHSGIRFY